jgi:TolB-like protein/class 3 adenylate cyclase/cytochrome c-type biogenesis protein CcmH/NrfG
MRSLLPRFPQKRSMEAHHGQATVSETRKLAAILVADIVGYSRLAGADEDRILARLRTLRSDLIDPIIAVHHGRIVKRTGDGSIIEFRSVVDAVRCAIEIQTGLIERNAGLPPDKRIEYRVGIHLGDVVEENDGDLMGDGVNIAARLEGVAKPGAVCLSEDAYRQVKSRLDINVIDLGPMALKNIAEPIRVYSLEVSHPTAAVSPSASVSQKAVPPRLSIVVLPFANIGADPEQDYFVDGVTESLTTDLSRISGAFVIGRSTAFSYKGKSPDLKRIGRELNVRYVLEGSVQRGGSRMRVNVQLIEAETGAHLWAERFEKPVVDLFEMHDEIVSRLANSLGVELVKAEARVATRDRSTNPDATDLVLRGWAAGYKGLSIGNMDEAIGYYERALQLDPENVQAQISLARMFARRLIYFPERAGRRDLDRAENLVKNAIAREPNNPSAHFVFGSLHYQRRRFIDAMAEVHSAIENDPNFAIAHAMLGMVYIAIGKAAEAFRCAGTAIRLSPRDPQRNIFEFTMGHAHAHLAQWQDAIDWCTKSIATEPSLYPSYVDLAAAYAWLGREEEAAGVVAELVKVKPDLTVQKWAGRNFSDDPTFQHEYQRIVDGLRKAGLPEE